VKYRRKTKRREKIRLIEEKGSTFREAYGACHGDDRAQHSMAQ
jgi:hypothetical protein